MSILQIKKLSSQKLNHLPKEPKELVLGFRHQIMDGCLDTRAHGVTIRRGASLDWGQTEGMESRCQPRLPQSPLPLCCPEFRFQTVLPTRCT